MFQMFCYAKWWIPSDDFLEWFDSNWINLVQKFAKCLEIPQNSPNIPWKSSKHLGFLTWLNLITVDQQNGKGCIFKVVKDLTSARWHLNRNQLGQEAEFGWKPLPGDQTCVNLIGLGGFERIWTDLKGFKRIWTNLNGLEWIWIVSSGFEWTSW